jgi:Zn finger protein HypA/HybF involved in hydrogenase expression
MSKNNECSKNIVSLDEKRLENSPHASGLIHCMACSHEWRGVFPIPITQSLECPECSSIRGVPKYEFTPEAAFTCNCGCDVFRVSVNNLVCLSCGGFTLLEDLL